MIDRPKRETYKKVAEGVYKRDGRYHIPVYDPETKKRRWHPQPKGTTLAQAKKARRELEEQKHRRKDAAQETVAEWAERWESAFPGRKLSTVRHNAERIKPFVRDFGHRPLASITPKEARLWITGGRVPADLVATAKDWKDAKEAHGILTVPAHRGNHAAVRVFMGDAQRSGIVNGNPFTQLRLPQNGGRRHIQVLTETEVDALAATAKRTLGEYGEHLADLILTAAWTGLRPGELFALIPERVDLDKGVLHVVESADNKTGTLWETKTETGARTVVLLPKARTALARVLEERAPGEFLFQPPRPRTRWHNQGKSAMRGMGFQYHWRSVRDAYVGTLPSTHWLPQRINREGRKGNFTLYELRHAAGTRLAERGVPAEDIAAFLGHRDGGVLAMKTYVHVSQSHSEDRIRRLFGEAA